MSADGKRVVMVYVNMQNSQNSVRINVEGQTEAKDINVYRTSETESLKHVNSAFSLGKLIAIPAKSVVTIVADFDNAIYTGINKVTDCRSNNGAIYSIDGIRQRSSSEGSEGLPKGIYIQNGKKFVVK